MSPVAEGPPQPADLGDLVYLAAQRLAERAGALAKDRPIVVTTIVSINDLHQSWTFGRLASELVGDRFVQRGYLVKELAYTRALTIEPATGELVLSRDAAQVSASVNAQAVVAGTYAVGGNEIYLTLRLIRADNGDILSSADVVIPLDNNTEPLLAGPPSYPSPAADTEARNPRG
jgi:TolB-like protein